MASKQSFRRISEQQLAKQIARRISEQGPQTVWRNIRDHVGGKRPSQRTVPLVSASDMNAYFVGVGPKAAREARQQGGEPTIPCRLPRVGACSFSVSPVDIGMLNRVVMSMPGTAACGLDGICVRVLKMCLPVSGGSSIEVDKALPYLQSPRYNTWQFLPSILKKCGVSSNKIQLLKA